MASAVIGSLRVNLGVDSSDFDKGVNRSRGILAGLAKAATGLIGIATVVKTINQFVSATVEADRVQAQLGAALKSTGNVAGQTIGGLNAHAKALMQLSTFDDEAIGGAQALLLTFTKIGGPIFDQATGAIIDVATAMGTDLRTATIQVGKALNDPVKGVTALAKAGIQFTESQKATIKSLVDTGHTVEAQRIILKELETQFGGSAKAARDTLGGALAGLRNAFGDLFELSSAASAPLRQAIEGLIVAITDPAFVTFAQTMGTLIFQALQAVVGAIIAVTDAVVFLSPYFNEIVGTGIALAGVLSVQLVGGLVAAAAAAFSFAGALAVVKTAVIGTGIGAVVVLAGLLIGKFIELTEKTGSVGTALSLVGDVGKEAFDRIVLLAQAGGLEIASVAEHIKSGFLFAFGEIVSGIGTAVNSIGRFIVEMANGVIATVEQMAQKAADAVNAIDFLDRFPDAKGPSLGRVKGGDLVDPSAGAGLLAQSGAAAADAMTLHGQAAAAAAQATAPREALQKLRAALDDTRTTTDNTAAAMGNLGTALTNNLAPDAGGGGGGAGKAKKGVDELKRSMEELQREAEQVFNETRTPAEKFAVQMASLNGLVNSGRISWDTYNRAVKQAQDALNETGTNGTNVMKNLGQSFQQTVAGFLQGTTTMSDAFSQMLSQLASALVTSGIAAAVKGIFPGNDATGGAGTGWVSTLMKSLGFAALGTQFGGGPTVVGERGPELLNLPRGAKVTPNGRLGGGNVFNFAPVYNAQGADPAQLARLKAENEANWSQFRSTFRGNANAAVKDRRNRGRI